MTLKDALAYKEFGGPFDDDMYIVRQFTCDGKFASYWIVDDSDLEFAKFGMSCRATVQEADEFLRECHHVLSWTRSIPGWAFSCTDWRVVTIPELVRWTQHTMEKQHET